MNPLLRNILAGLAGAVVSMPANMLLLKPLANLTGAPTLPAPPDGATMAEIQALYAPMIAAMTPDQPWWAWSLDLAGYLPAGGLGWTLANILRRKRFQGT